MTDNTTRRAVLGALPVIAAAPAAAALPVADPIHEVTARFLMAWNAQIAA